ncbi:hypothetical protein ACFL27_04580 [candidate division CSSED10-310 bacterium]|uniref:PKD domain-containing protein n=1 Tax=candidate division CSSED10-310 bacterium TaxID=2855610 RepID=A0ABV6YTG5_UNCC1
MKKKFFSCQGLIFIALMLFLFQSMTVFAARNVWTLSVVIIEQSGLDWKEARHIIEQYGGKLLHILPPHALIGEIPDGAVYALTHPEADRSGKLLWDGESVVILKEHSEAVAYLGPKPIEDIQREFRSLEAVVAARFLMPETLKSDLEAGLVREEIDGSLSIVPISEWEEPPLDPVELDLTMDRGIGNTWNNTGDFLAGDIAIGVCRPESNGGDGSNAENWTAQEVTDTYNELVASMNRLAIDAANGQLTFVYRTEHAGAGVTGTVDCYYEAINYSNWTSAVVLNMLGNLGYSQANYYSRLLEWANDLRSDLGTDWAYGFIIVDESATGGGRASAYYNGPAVWIFSTNNYKVYHHESGHSWGARDEYHPDAAQSPTSLAGYTQDVNANSQYNDGTGFYSGAGEGIMALMINNIDYISPWTRGQWGTWDLDGDGIYEPEDTFPTVTLNAPTGTEQLTFTGTATATALKLETGANATTDITINRIVNVEWRMNGGPWQDATATDGTFDSSSENYTFTTPNLANGGVVVEVRAQNNFGNTSMLYDRRDQIITGSGTSNASPLVGLTVTPTLGSTTTTFSFSACTSTDPEDGTIGLNFRWDYTNDGGYDTSWSPTCTTTQSYGSPGAKTAKVQVQDQNGNTAVRTVNFTVAASNVSPTATFNVDKGMEFASTPVTFNFDASAVSDGEDATSALQVRWDFQDDGTWDTSYSTTKTASNDYAQGYVINPSNESLNTYFYGGNNVEGLAQSFVAQTNLIGKAELILWNNNDVTPGGNITVGIRTTLTGAWLTSITVNQSTITDYVWTLFDFPDLAVTIGNTYYLVLLGSDGDMMWAGHNSSNPYPNGSHWYSSDFGANWTNNTSYDHTFRIYDGNLTTVPLTKSKIWRVRMEVLDTNGNTSQAVRDVVGCSYNTKPTVSVGSAPTAGTIATTYNLTATGADANSATSWDGMVHYRFDKDNDGNFENQFSATNTYAATFTRSGLYSATVEVRDRYHATARATVDLYVAPTLTSSTLSDKSDGSTTDTDERDIFVQLSTGGQPQEVLLSEDAGFSGATWQTFTPKVTFTLSASGGLKTVYSKTRSGVGNETGYVSQTITYTPSVVPTLNTYSFIILLLAIGILMSVSQYRKWQQEECKNPGPKDQALG